MQESDLFKLIGEPNRYQIFMMLMIDQFCVCDIERFLNLKQANVSKHLKYFKDLALLDFEKDEKWIYYRLSSAFLEEHALLIKYLKTSETYQCFNDALKQFIKGVCN